MFYVLCSIFFYFYSTYAFCWGEKREKFRIICDKFRCVSCKNGNVSCKFWNVSDKLARIWEREFASLPPAVCITLCTICAQFCSAWVQFCAVWAPSGAPKIPPKPHFQLKNADLAFFNNIFTSAGV